MNTGNFPAKQASRRVYVITHLENQLATNTKRTREGIVPLGDSDRSRIVKEIETLKSRIPISPRGLRSKKHSGSRRARA